MVFVEDARFTFWLLSDLEEVRHAIHKIFRSHVVGSLTMWWEVLQFR